jgi:hypothetical protein
VYRSSDSGSWEDGSGWWREYTDFGFQILSMQTYNGGIYGAGSTISQPPHVFLPRRDGAFGFEAIQLATGLGEYDGEMWSIHVDEEGVVVGGVDQNRNVGMVYFSGSDPYNADGWSSLDLSAFEAEESTWVRGVCRNNGVTLIAAEFSRLGDGLLLRSDDGSTFTDITSSLMVDGGEIPPIQRCQILDDGTEIVAGAAGFIASRRP